MYRRFLTPFIVVAIVSIATRPARAQMPPALVQVATVELEQLAPTILLPGTVISLDDSRVSANVGGTVVRVAEVGDSVKLGEPIAYLDQVNLKLNRIESQNMVARETSRITFLSREVDRLKRLAEQNNAARSALEQTQSDLDVARSDKRAAEARLTRIETDLERTLVKAPFDGIVTERFVNPGEALALGAPVARLVGSARLEVSARAPIRSVHYIDKGTALNISNPFIKTIGTLRTKVPTADRRAHMFELRIEVDGSLFSVNEDVRVEVPTAAAEAVLIVPRDALVLRRDQTTVYRIGDDMLAQAVTVATGPARGDRISVTGDLAAGDRVIIRGAERLQPGQTVQIVNDSGPSDGGAAPGSNSQ